MVDVVVVVSSSSRRCFSYLLLAGTDEYVYRLAGKRGWLDTRG